MTLSDLLMPNRLTPAQSASRRAIWQSSSSGGEDRTQYPRTGFTNPAYKPGMVWIGRHGWQPQDSPFAQRMVAQSQRCPMCGQVIGQSKPMPMPLGKSL